MQEPPRIVIRREELPADGIPGPQPDRNVVSMARLAAALGVLSILFAGVAVGPLAVICGLVALTRRSTDSEKGRLLAATGIATGAVGLVLWLGLAWWFLGRVDRAQQVAVPQPGGHATLDRAAVDRSPFPIRRALLGSVSLSVEARQSARWIPRGAGSGSVIATRDSWLYILTCRHVVESVGDEEVRLRATWLDGSSEVTRIEWMGSGRLDLALVSAQMEEGAAAPAVVPIGRPDRLAIGARVFAVGDPLRYRASFVQGVISAARRIDAMSVFQTQIPLNPGNSGGGLYTDSGELIAVNSWTLPKGVVEGMGFSISVQNLWEVVEQLPEAVVHVLREAWTEDPAESRN